MNNLDLRLNLSTKDVIPVVYVSSDTESDGEAISCFYNYLDFLNSNEDRNNWKNKIVIYTREFTSNVDRIISPDVELCDKFDYLSERIKNIIKFMNEDLEWKWISA